LNLDPLRRVRPGIAYGKATKSGGLTDALIWISRGAVFVEIVDMFKIVLVLKGFPQTTKK